MGVGNHPSHFSEENVLCISVKHGTTNKQMCLCSSLKQYNDKIVIFIRHGDIGDIIFLFKEKTPIYIFNSA